MSPARSDWSLIFFGLSLSSLAAFQQFKLPPILPLLLARFDYDRTLAGGFMSVYALAGLLFSLQAASLIQRHGAARPVLLALLAMAAACLVILSFPANGWFVLAARLVEGLAFAVLAVAGPSLANSHATARALPLVIGMTAAWIPNGQVLATLLAQPALDWDVWWLMPLGGAALALALAAWTWRLAPGARLKMGAGSAAVPLPLTAEERLSLRLSAAVFMIFSGQFFAYMTWLPQYLVEVLAFGMRGALWAYLVPVVTLLLWNVGSGLLLRRGLSVGALLQAGMAMMALCWFLLPYTGADVGGLLSLVVFGIGAGLAPTCLFAMPSRICRPGASLVPAFGILMGGRNFGVLLGPVVLAELSKETGGWTLAAPLFGAITAVGVGLALWLTLRLPRHGTNR